MGVSPSEGAWYIPYIGGASWERWEGFPLPAKDGNFCLPGEPGWGDARRRVQVRGPRAGALGGSTHLPSWGILGVWGRFWGAGEWSIAWAPSPIRLLPIGPGFPGTGSGCDPPPETLSGVILRGTRWIQRGEVLGLPFRLMGSRKLHAFSCNTKFLGASCKPGILALVPVLGWTWIVPHVPEVTL